MPTLRIEHVAMNVADPPAMAAWYVRHLGMEVVRRADNPQRVHFLADGHGATVLEIYNSAADPVPDYAAMSPARLHVAFDADDLETAKEELLAAGATYVDEMRLEDGSRLLMLRDPWGLPLQLARRVTPLLPQRS